MARLGNHDFLFCFCPGQTGTGSNVEQRQTGRATKGCKGKDRLFVDFGFYSRSIYSRKNKTLVRLRLGLMVWIKP